MSDEAKHTEREHEIETLQNLLEQKRTGQNEDGVTVVVVDGKDVTIHSMDTSVVDRSISVSAMLSYLVERHNEQAAETEDPVERAEMTHLLLSSVLPMGEIDGPIGDVFKRIFAASSFAMLATRVGAAKAEDVATELMSKLTKGEGTPNSKEHPDGAAQES